MTETNALEATLSSELHAIFKLGLSSLNTYSTITPESTLDGNLKFRITMFDRSYIAIVKPRSTRQEYNLFVSTTKGTIILKELGVKMNASPYSLRTTWGRLKLIALGWEPKNRLVIIESKLATVEAVVLGYGHKSTAGTNLTCA